ncbi:MAG: hypothetical protein ABI435_01415 [Pseudolysinimonas sp.]
MTGWLRRNRWYLIALVALIPVAVVVALVPRFFPYLERVPQPQDVARGQVVDYAGAHIALTDLEVLDGADYSAPGADVVVATLSVDVFAPADSSYCDLSLMSNENGTARTWSAELFSKSDYRVPDSYASSCDLTTAGSYELQQTFLVPHDEVVKPTVQFSSFDALPKVLRLH